MDSEHRFDCHNRQVDAEHLVAARSRHGGRDPRYWNITRVLEEMSEQAPAFFLGPDVPECYESGKDTGKRIRWGALPATTRKNLFSKR